MIVTANIFFKISWELYNQTIIKPMLVKYGLIDLGVADDPLRAEVNHGVWIAKCECGGAEKVWEERIFMCQSCWNATHKHQYRRVILPKQRKEIEAILLKRPLPNRNFLIGESAEQLQLENDQHKEELL